MMVDYPTPQTGNVTGPIRSSLSEADIAGPYSLLAHGLQKTGAALDDVASSLADQAGVKAVTTDADGNIQVEHAPIVGPAAEHYANAVKFAALAEGEGAVRRKDIELRTEFRDDPAGYLQAADAFTKKMQEQYTQAAGPLVGVALRKAIEPITTQTYRGLLNEKERLDLHRSVAAIDSGVEQAQNAMYAMARGGVTSGPEWDAAWDKVRTLTGQKVGNPRLAYPREKADNDMSKFDTELRIQAGMHRIVDEEYKENGYDEALKSADKIRTDPSLNMTPEQREAAYHRVVSELNTKARDDERVLKGVAADIGAVNKLSLSGTPVSPERLGQVKQAVEATGNPELKRMMQQAEGINNWSKDMRQATPAQMEQSRANIEEVIRKNGNSETAQAMLEANDKLLKAARTGIAKDQLDWSTRTGFMAVPPIQFASPDAAGQMVDRAARAKIIAQQYGTPVKFFREDEKSALEAAVSAGGPEMEKVAALIVDGFGNDAPQAMKELTKSAPVLAHVGALQLSGGDPGFTRDVVDGVKMRNDPEFQKTMPQGMKATPTNVIFAAQSARQQDVYGGAFALLPDTARRTSEAANNAFFTRAYRNSYDMALGTESRVPVGVKDQSTSQKAYDDALQQSAGAHFIGNVQYGGVSTYRSRGGFLGMGTTSDKVLVPNGVKADRFKDVIGAITDDDLSKMAISPDSAKARDIQRALPVAVDGGYVFAVGDPKSSDPRYIKGALGAPFKLDFNQMEPVLRGRVPDAFLGGGTPTTPLRASADTGEFTSDDPNLTKDQKDAILNYKAHEDPEADPGTAFMRAGNVPKVGELSSAPSKNIEDRRGQFGPDDESPRSISKLRDELEKIQKGFEGSELQKSLGSRADVYNVHIQRLMDIANEDVPLPRRRPKK